MYRLPLDGIPNRAGQRGSVQFIFDQVVLGVLLQDLDSERDVESTCEHYDRYIGCDLPKSGNDLDARPVRKSQVQKNQVDVIRRQVPLRSF